MKAIMRIGAALGASLVMVGSEYGRAQSPNQSPFAIPAEQIGAVERAALLGDADAARRLVGYDLLFGESEGGREMLFWTEIAAQNGDAAAEYSLGYRMSCGRSARDVLRSRFWLAKARDHGNESAKRLLASMDRGEWPLSPTALDQGQQPPE